MGIYPNETEDRGLIFNDTLICENNELRQIPLNKITILWSSRRIPESWYGNNENNFCVISDKSSKKGIDFCYNDQPVYFLADGGMGHLTDTQFQTINIFKLQIQVSTNSANNKFYINGIKVDEKNLEWDLKNNFFLGNGSSLFLKAYNHYIYFFKVFSGILHNESYNKYSNYLYSVLYNE